MKVKRNFQFAYPVRLAAIGAAFFPFASKALAQGDPAFPARLLPQNLTPWGMFLNADMVVKTVMVGLILASLVTWTVMLVKIIELRREKGQVREKLLWLNQARALAAAEKHFTDDNDVVTRFLRAASHEIQLSGVLRGDGLKERISWQLERIEARAGRRAGRGMGLLASIGATAPFVGLFGTVWGIMNSFVGISQAHTTSLAVVAPGIAEALLATALGLFAAIPAVVIYNVFARSIGGYRALLADVSTMVMRLVSRDLDRDRASLGRAAE